MWAKGEGKKVTLLLLLLLFMSSFLFFSVCATYLYNITDAQRLLLLSHVGKCSWKLSITEFWVQQFSNIEFSTLELRTS